MTRYAQRPFSYRDDPSVAEFSDRLPLVVYDGICGLCSGWVRFILRRDGAQTRHLFASAQSGLGRALYKHYGLSPDDPETLLVIKDGGLHAKGEAVAVVLAGLGFLWSLMARMMRLVPSGQAERAYDSDLNSARIFGTSDITVTMRIGMTSRPMRKPLLETVVTNSRFATRPLALSAGGQ